MSREVDGEQETTRSRRHGEGSPDARCPATASQSVGRSLIREGAEAAECEPRLFAAGPNVERGLSIGRSEIASAKPLMQLRAVDQRRVAAVRTQRYRFGEVG